MAHKTSRKGGRSWWGKREAKAAGRITRRRDDLAESTDIYIDPDAFERFIRTADATALADIIEIATGCPAQSVSVTWTPRIVTPPA